MRIPSRLAEQALVIIAEQYGSDAMVWLFGSRADDKKRGGDVDIYVESAVTDLMRKIRCKSQLADLFDLDVDLVVGKGDKPIHRIAKETGVRLK